MAGRGCRSRSPGLGVCGRVVLGDDGEGAGSGGHNGGQEDEGGRDETVVQRMPARAEAARLPADWVTAPYDVAVGLPLGTDPMPYAEAGATWWMPDLAPDTLSRDQVRDVVRDGPAPAS